jgi:hypothetical protein
MDGNAGADDADVQPGPLANPCDAVTQEHVGVAGITVLRGVLDPATKDYFESDMDDLSLRQALDTLLPGMAASIAAENDERECVHRAFFLYLLTRRDFNRELLGLYVLESVDHPASGWAEGDPPPEVPERTRLVIEHYSHSIEWLNRVVGRRYPNEPIEDLFARGLFPEICSACDCQEAANVD